MTFVGLDESQIAAVDINPGVRQVVVAGPGSGKTEVISRLVEHLVESEGLDVVDGVLVISFSNAAVFAADARLRARGLGSVTGRTLDSLASEIINDLSQQDIAALSFDRRVQLATDLLRGEKWDRIEGLEHLVVDEVQDIVGHRAELLLALLDILPEDCGFSLLGDPAQGIYDWQLRTDARSASNTTSQDFFAQVRGMARTEARELTGQYRAKSRDALQVMELRNSVLEHDPQSPLEQFFANIVSLGSLPDLVQSAKQWHGTTAFLTENNGQALLAGDALATLGAPAEVRRAAHQRVLAGWIARIASQCARPTATRDELAEALAGARCEVDPAVAWQAFRAVTGGRGREVDLLRISAALGRRQALPLTLLEPTHSPFVVSTVHRAKGLEFDNVVSLDFPARRWPESFEQVDDGGESARELFVALTRARRLLIRAEGPDDRSLRSFSPRGSASKRWYIGGPKSFMTHGFEIKIDDLDRSKPPGIDPEVSQALIATAMRPGDPLELRLDTDASTLTMPYWTLLHSGVAVGRTSEEFGATLVHRIRTLEKKRHGWPSLSGARVEAISTVAGPPQAGNAGHHGLWLAPVCAGILRLNWNGDANA